MSNQENIKAQSVPDSHLLFEDIAGVIRQVRLHIQQTVNTAMVQSYWQIVHLIVANQSDAEYEPGTGNGWSTWTSRYVPVSTLPID